MSLAADEHVGSMSGLPLGLQGVDGLSGGVMAAQVSSDERHARLERGRRQAVRGRSGSRRRSSTSALGGLGAHASQGNVGLDGMGTSSGRRHRRGGEVSSCSVAVHDTALVGRRIACRGAAGWLRGLAQGAQEPSHALGAGEDGFELHGAAATGALLQIDVEGPFEKLMPWAPDRAVGGRPGRGRCAVWVLGCRLGRGWNDETRQELAAARTP